VLLRLAQRWSTEVAWGSIADNGVGGRSGERQDPPDAEAGGVVPPPYRFHTVPGDIGYEPFAGSGSQIIAAERAERRCFAVELDPKYCDVIIERWQRITGGKAKRA
jgi:DNA modification methylase